ERSWIARELHDDFNQRVALLAVILEKVKQDLPASERRGIEEASQQVADLGRDIHALSHRLHSSKLEYLGLVAACESFCRELSGQQNVEIDFHSQDIPKELPQEIALSLFRVLQEGLQNAVKHSGVRRFEVSLGSAWDEIHMSVHDSGVGFDLQKAMSGHGLGFASMKERMKLIGGHLSIDLKPQGGTTIHARAPLRLKTMSRGAGGQLTTQFRLSNGFRHNQLNRLAVIRAVHGHNELCLVRPPIGKAPASTHMPESNSMHNTKFTVTRRCVMSSDKRNSWRVRLVAM